MKRYTVFIIFALIVFVSCNKQEATDVFRMPGPFLCLENAEDEVSAMIKQINPFITRSGQSVERTVRSSWTKKLIPGVKLSENPSADLYILNFNDSLGFAIVSSDPAKGILGLALSGSYEEGDSIDNPGFAITLANLEAFAKTPTRVDSIAYYEYGPWIASNYVPNTGYCPVKWEAGDFPYNQYNAYCPAHGTIHYLAGCVAVATAQLMAMYKYPSSYGSYSFDWDSMILDSSAQNNQGEYYVGRLLQQLGLPGNLGIDYTHGSGSNIAYIPQTLENFGYGNGGSFHNFYSFDMIDLRGGYPIIMRGETSSGGAHAWLGHGLLEYSRTVHGCGENGEILFYDTELRSYILCNFGVGGAADGYYSTWAFTTTNGPEYLDPSQSSSSTWDYDFPYSIRCVSGIRPYL